MKKTIFFLFVFSLVATFAFSQEAVSPAQDNLLAESQEDLSEDLQEEEALVSVQVDKNTLEAASEQGKQ